jgi:hypothetical protein
VFVLTVCNPSAPADGDSFDDKSFKEKSIPNLFIEGKELSSHIRIFCGFDCWDPNVAEIGFEFDNQFVHESFLFGRIIAQSIQWSVPFLVIETSPPAIINVKIKQHVLNPKSADDNFVEGN